MRSVLHICIELICTSVERWTAAQAHAQEAVTITDVLIWPAAAAAHKSKHCIAVAVRAPVMSYGT